MHPGFASLVVLAFSTIVAQETREPPSQKDHSVYVRNEQKEKSSFATNHGYLWRRNKPIKNDGFFQKRSLPMEPKSNFVERNEGVVHMKSSFQSDINLTLRMSDDDMKDKINGGKNSCDDSKNIDCGKQDGIEKSPPKQMPEEEECSSGCDKKDDMMKSIPPIDMPEEEECSSGCDKKDDKMKSTPTEMPKKEKCSDDCGKQDGIVKSPPMQMPEEEEFSSGCDQDDDVKIVPPMQMPKKEKCSGDCDKKDGLVKSPLIEMPQEKEFASGFDQDDDVKIVPPLQMPKKEKCSGDCGKEDDNLFSKKTPTPPSVSGTKVLIIVDGRPKIPQPSSGSILQESSGELRPPPISNKFSGFDTLAPPKSDQSLFDPSQKNPQASNIPIINANANSGIVFNAAAVKIRTPCSTISIALILSFMAFLLSN